MNQIVTDAYITRSVVIIFGYRMWYWRAKTLSTLMVVIVKSETLQAAKAVVSSTGCKEAFWVI